tara:strand:- start:469 stop:1134 length:666 start_codon:yes stop_codon:yes gene_type:complete
MAQDFESNSVSAVGSTPQDTPSGADFSSDNTIIGIHMANRSQNQITASAYITSSVQEIGKDLNFVVTVAGGNFVIDGQTKPALTLYKGFTYTFDVSDSSNATHVLAFATQEDAANSSQYTTNVTSTGTPGQAGARVTIETTQSTPTTLYYYCTAHTQMGNSITLSNVVYLIKDAPIASGGALQLLTGGAKIVLQNGHRIFFQSDTPASLDVWVSRVDAIST